jgi:uncharacterized lipoprotein YddW (UPF0748 family)
MLCRLFLISVVFLTACTASKKTTSTANLPPQGPHAEKEFRAAWVATVANINWPSRPGLPVDSQKAEAIRLLDYLADHHFNAVVFQVRPQADALYQSSLEPWSYYLTGQQGKAPEPFYDPLSFWTEAAHDRGIELHVWLNPYRAHHAVGGPVTDSSLVKRKPELVVQLKQGYWWFDPSLKGTQDHAVNVVMDIVKRYDIDGVHFDDYFYPYPEYNNGEDFPDSASWSAYQASGGKLSRGDWRRKAVNDLIQRLYKEIKNTKPWVKFGLSPFGMWRPGYPESTGGFDQYDILYADAKLWLNKGWIDYFAPQLYWPINRISQSFPVLLGWWSGENLKGRHLWPGISVGTDTSKATVNETLSQIMITRGMLPGDKGVIHWSISSDMKNPVLSQALLNGPYRNDALVPNSPWLDKQPPLPPNVTTSNLGDSVQLSWTHPEVTDVFRWVVYFQYGQRWSYVIRNRNDHSFTLPATLRNGTKLSRIAVSAVDRTGNESTHPELVLPSR